MKSKPKKVALFIENSRKSGRGLLRGIARYANTRNNWVFYRPNPFYIQSKEANLKEIRSNLEKWNVQGIISREPQKILPFIKKKTPVIIAISCKQYDQIPKIISDSEEIGKIAAEHFLHKGFTQFAFCGYESIYWSDLRKQHFCKWIEKASYKVNVYKSSKQKPIKWSDEIQLLCKWLKSVPKPIAIFTCNDDRGSQVIEACKTVGINIPNQAAILGVDNDDLVCDLVSPSLSSISLDFEQTGFEAARLLDNKMRYKNFKSKNIILKPTHIITRQSTNILAIQDQATVRAMEFIIENKRNIITVDQTAQAASLSRRTLERRFRELLGCSVLKEIKRIRINEIAQMLIDTNLSIKQIASIMKLKSTTHVSRYFKNEKGMSPTSFRLKHKIQ